MARPLVVSLTAQLSLIESISRAGGLTDDAVETLPRGVAWLDTGTHEVQLQASTFIQTIEKRQGLMVACVEEIAFKMGYIDGPAVTKIAEPMRKSGYGEYLLGFVESVW